MGLVVFIVGVYLKVLRFVYIEFLDSCEFEIGIVLCVFVGIIVVVVFLIGFWGLWMKSKFIFSLVRILYFILEC